MTWPTFLASCAAVTALFALIDRLHGIEAKDRLHTMLLRTWVFLEETPIPNFPTAIARVSFSQLSQLAASRLTLAVALLVSALTSIVLTTQAFAFGVLIDDRGGQYHPLIMFSALSGGQLTLALLANILFDAISTGLAIWVLYYLAVSNDRWAPLKALAGFLFGAFLIAEKAFGALVAIVQGFELRFFYTAGEYFFQDRFWIETLYAVSMLIPWSAYLLLLFLCFFVKPIAEILARGLKYVFQVEAEKSPKEVAPWTLLGLVATTVGSVAKLAYELLKST